MHDIWNPWHGCEKCSEGCQNCYMYFLDRVHERNGAEIYRTKTGFNYPIQKNRQGKYLIQSGELIRVCMSSDFFLPQADGWRAEAWELMRIRSDVKFFLLTKRPHRIKDCLPADWGDGWDNIFLNVTCENQKRADERIPLLLEIPARHKGIMCAPFIGEVSIKLYLLTGQIEQVICGGENYDGARPCHYEWVYRLHEECAAANVSFCFIETGNSFVRDGKQYRIQGKQTQSRLAFETNLNYSGKEIQFHLTGSRGETIPPDRLFVPHFRENCRQCASRQICNGCSDCGRCKGDVLFLRNGDLVKGRLF